MSLKELNVLERRDAVLKYLEIEHSDAFKGYEVVHPTTGETHRSFAIGIVPKFLKTLQEIRLGSGLEMGNIPFDDLSSILDLLIEDGYVLKEKTARTQMEEMYMISHKGISFNYNDGYCEADRKNRKKEKLEGLSRSLFWVPMAVGFVSLCFTGATYYNNSAKISDLNFRMDSILKINTVAKVDGEHIIDSTYK